MNHPTVELIRADRAMRMEDATARRQAAAARQPRSRRRLSAVLSRVRRVERRVPAPRPA